MDIPVITAIVGALSALLGTVIGAIFQLRQMKQNHAFQLQLEMAKWQSEQDEKGKIAQRQRLLDSHKAISRIARDFSITSLDIAWRSGMTDQEYDQRYLACCEALDEVRAICDLYIPDVSEYLQKMYGQMNIFWGNFKDVLRLEALREPYEKQEGFHSRTIQASEEIGAIANQAKGRLRVLIEQYS